MAGKRLHRQSQEAKVATATTQPLLPNSHLSDTSNDESNPSRGMMKGACSEIILASLVVVVSMLCLSAFFVRLVLIHQVSPDTSASPDLLRLPADQQSTDTAFYVDYDATKLITVSSWASTAASLLPSSVMVLLSYPIAKRINDNSRNTISEKLPTPFQFNILISLLSGNLGAMWTWVKYSFWKRRERQVSIIRTAVTGLTTALILSLAILGVDTWLHITTTTVLFEKINAVASPESRYSRGVASICSDAAQQISLDTCVGSSLSDGENSAGLPDGTEAFLTLANQSNTNTVATMRVGQIDVAYIREAQPREDLDYQASTLAIGTQCRAISRECHLTYSSSCVNPDRGVCLSRDYNLNFDCNPALAGNLAKETGTPWEGVNMNLPSYIGFFLQYFFDNDLQQPVAQQLNYTPSAELPALMDLSYLSLRNPYYFATGAMLIGSDKLRQDSEVVWSSDTDMISFILNCNTTVYNLIYNSVNGTATSQQLTLANDTMAVFFGSTMYTNGSRVIIQDTLEKYMMDSGALNTSQALADSFGLGFARVALSIAASVISPMPTLKEQTRDTLLVARIPQVPFYTLIGLDLLYALLGICLAIVAFASQPRQVRDVQARLSVAGLVASLFEGERAVVPVHDIKDLFSEQVDGTRSLHVAITMADDGSWDYAVVEGR